MENRVRFVHEFIAICIVIIGFVLKTEVTTGGSGATKKAQAVSEIMNHLRTPDGLYIQNEYVLKAIEGLMNAFLLDLLVKLFKGQAFLGDSDKPSS